MDGNLAALAEHYLVGGLRVAAAADDTQGIFLLLGRLHQVVHQLMGRPLGRRVSKLVPRVGAGRVKEAPADFGGPGLRGAHIPPGGHISSRGGTFGPLLRLVD